MATNSLLPALLASLALFVSCAPASGEPEDTSLPTSHEPQTGARQAPAPREVSDPLPDAVASAPPGRTITQQRWTPMASVGSITLRHPSARVERVAFHEANHDGARQLEPLPTAVVPVTLETRERGTGSRSAADVVVDPETEIRAPVTGTVKRAGGYVLYCDYSDDFVVIAPDAEPSWEVKILHIDGVAVRAGDRVVAGQTVLAPRPTKLPFESQVDEIATAQAWPHVHLEVVDPSIPDRPSAGGGCR